MEEKYSRKKLKEDVQAAVKEAAKPEEKPKKPKRKRRKKPKYDYDSMTIKELRDLVKQKRDLVLQKAGFDSKLPRARAKLIALCERLKK